MKNKLDIIGAVVSIGCLIHCLLVPVVIPLLPMFGLTLNHGPWFHTVIAVIVISIAIVALVLGYKKHKKVLPLHLGARGFILLVTSAGLEFYGQASGVIMGVTILGSIYMIIAHYLNHRYLCKCNHHHGNHACQK